MLGLNTLDRCNEMPRKKIEEEYITDAEAKEVLESMEEREIPFRKSLDEYLKDTVRLDPETSKKLVQDLVEQANLTRKDAIMLANLMPTNVTEIKALMSGGTRAFISNEQAEKAAEIIKKYTQK